MDNLEKEFERRIAEIHILDGVGIPVEDIRHAEFKALTDVFLGADYDQAKLTQIENLQIAQEKEQATLFERYESGELGPEEYVDAFNNGLDELFKAIHSVLGTTDFHRLFGSEIGFIDKNIFLKEHYDRS